MVELKKEDKTIHTYFHKMKVLSNSLTSMGEPLRDAELVTYILGGLDSTYDALFQVVTNRATPIPICAASEYRTMQVSSAMLWWLITLSCCTCRCPYWSSCCFSCC